MWLLSQADSKKGGAATFAAARCVWGAGGFNAESHLFVAVLHTVVDITKYLGIEIRRYAIVAKYFLLSLLACAPALYVCTLPQFWPTTTMVSSMSKVGETR